MNFKRLALALVCLVAMGTNVAMAEEGSFLFSKDPIDPADPQNTATRFSAGDHIYGLIQLPRAWRDVGRVADGKVIMAVYTIVGSKRLAAYMELRSDAHSGARHLRFDIAPALDKMTAYRDDGVFYGDAPEGRCHPP